MSFLRSYKRLRKIYIIIVTESVYDLKDYNGKEQSKEYCHKTVSYNWVFCLYKLCFLDIKWHMKKKKILKIQTVNDKYVSVYVGTIQKHLTYWSMYVENVNQKYWKKVKLEKDP